MAETVVVTRHLGLVEYLIELGLCSSSDQVISHATVEDVKGKHVIGVLPLSLAVAAESVTEVPMSIPVELRGQELTLQQMRMYGGKPRTYRVTFLKE
jgi:putative CRISPR-associated protein (TIGR02620 family)